MGKFKEIRPQPHQEPALSSKAEITINGGQAGGGKTWNMCANGARGSSVPGFSGMIFRRQVGDIGVGKQGTLWAEAKAMYRILGGREIAYRRMFEFQTGKDKLPATIEFDGMEYEKNAEDHQGKSYAFLGFEEVCHFTAHQFHYLRTRNRLGPGCSGVIPWTFATCNPDPDSFVFDLVKPFLDDNLYPHPEICGTMKYFIFEGDDYEPHWVGPNDLGSDGQEPTSITFIPARLIDNRIFMDANPAYFKKLNSMPKYLRDALLGGCWGVRRGTSIFEGVVPRFAAPSQIPSDLKMIRAWDRGSRRRKTGTDPDMSSGAKGGHRIASDGVREFWITDLEYFQGNPADCVHLIRNCAHMDGGGVPVYLEEETGSSGKDVTYFYRNEVLRDYDVRAERPSGDKGSRATGWIEDGNNGRLVIVRANWNRALLDSMQAFPGGKRDLIDAVSLLHSASLKHPWPTKGGVIEGKSRIGKMRQF